MDRVACLSCRDCVVSVLVSLAFAVPGAARATASGWSIQHTPRFAGGGDLYDVSCVSARACTAVGTCVSAHVCTVVDSYANHCGGFESGCSDLALAERWNGTKWSIRQTPIPTGAFSAHLNGVSCVSARACVAVGYYLDERSYAGLMLAERWDGTKWSIKQTPNPVGATQSELNGVSCSSATACTAVGDYDHGTLAERWDGTKWSTQQTPNPTGASASVLSGVSCSSATACTAVGEFQRNGVTTWMLAERWDGTRWSIQQIPNPRGGLNDVVEGPKVSCVSARACTAVGTGGAYDRHTTLAERWDGTKWSIQDTPNPVGATYSYLYGVSCVSARDCTAVGGYSAGALAERWDGTKWSIQHTPNPVGATYSYLNGVSCVSARACTAVGDYTHGTLAERWNRRG